MRSSDDEIVSTDRENIAEVDAMNPDVAAQVEVISHTVDETETPVRAESVGSVDRKGADRRGNEADQSTIIRSKN